jgi:peptidyl-prolyl cis-trans isomerase C
MPRRRRRSVPVPAWDRDRGAIGRRVAGMPPRYYAAAGVIGLVIVALGLVAFAFANDYIQDRNRPGSTAIRVEDTNYTVRYFTERLRRYIQQNGGSGSLFGQQPQAALTPLSDELINEALLLRFAEEKGSTVTEDEVKAELATMLTLTGPDDPNFETRFREELARTNLTEQQYRDMAKAAVLKRKVEAQFTAELPATAESIHYRQIALETTNQTEGDAVVREIEAGADFAEIAKQRSALPSAAEDGGEAGWVPRGVLDPQLEDTLFALEAAELTVYPSQSNVYVYQVLEKQADRPIEEGQKASLSSRAFREWLDEKRASVRVVNDMEFPGGNIDKIQYALSRVQTT